MSSRTGGPRIPVFPFLAGAAAKAVRAWRQGRLPISPAHWARQLRQYRIELQREPAASSSSAPFPTRAPSDPYERWRTTNHLTRPVVERMAEAASGLVSRGPLISIVVPTYETPEAFLRDLLRSVQSQIYPNWELCVADDASASPHVREILEHAVRHDRRIRVEFRTRKGHIAEATNTALCLATGSFVAFLDHDDLLAPDALLHVAECLAQHPGTDWVYTDEDKIDEEGRHFDPQFKGGWDPEMAITHNYTHHLAVIRRSLVEGVGRMRPGFEGAQDLDLFLRVAERTTPDRIRHVPHVAYHWRVHGASTASRGRQKDYVFPSAECAIREAVARRGLRAEPFLPSIADHFGLCLYQLRWDPTLLAAMGGVTIVVPTRDRIDLLERCITSLHRTVDHRFVQVLIADDESAEPATRRYLSTLEHRSGLRCRVLRVPRLRPGFNYARLMNVATGEVDTPYVLHLHNDIVAISPGWLEDMMGWLSVQGVGVVGARLVYPDKTLQHGGVKVGARDGLAGHLFHRIHRDQVGPNALPHAARNVSAVTGACLLTPISLFGQLGGFDEKSFGVQYNSVDYCLRVWATGRRVLCTPQAELIHAVAPEAQDFDPGENLSFLARYPGIRDRFLNPSIDVDSSTLTPNPHQYVHTARAKWPLRLLLVSHNLNYEGAPLILLDHARSLRDQGCELTVIAPAAGPLRDIYEAMGVPVTVCPFAPLGDDVETWRRSMRDKSERLCVAMADLVIANTLVAYHGIELARLTGVPSLWLIHESVSLEDSLETFFGASSRGSMRALLSGWLSQSATRVVFQARATADLFADLNYRDHFRVLPGYLDTGRIDAHVAATDRDAERARLGIDADEIVILAVGTICERKAQHLLVDAIKEVRSAANRRLRCLLVGARDDQGRDEYLARVRQQTVEHGLSNVVALIPETGAVNDYYRVADLFVLASGNESFPRVLLEAMAFGLPIVSSKVFGVPEMLTDGHDALLVPSGDATALAGALRRLIQNPALAASLGRQASATVRHRFTPAHRIPQFIDLVKEATTQPSV